MLASRAMSPAMLLSPAVLGCGRPGDVPPSACLARPTRPGLFCIMRSASSMSSSMVMSAGECSTATCGQGDDVQHQPTKECMDTWKKKPMLLTSRCRKQHATY